MEGQCHSLLNFQRSIKSESVSFQDIAEFINNLQSLSIQSDAWFSEWLSMSSLFRVMLGSVNGFPCPVWLGHDLSRSGHTRTHVRRLLFKFVDFPHFSFNTAFFHY